jgi:hypothetical protein
MQHGWISTQLQDNAQQPLLRIGRFLKLGKDKEVWLLAYVPNYSSKTFLKVVTFPFKYVAKKIIIVCLKIIPFFVDIQI